MNWIWFILLFTCAYGLPVDHQPGAKVTPLDRDTFDDEDFSYEAPPGPDRSESNLHRKTGSSGAGGSEYEKEKPGKVNMSRADSAESSKQNGSRDKRQIGLTFGVGVPVAYPNYYSPYPYGGYGYGGGPWGYGGGWRRPYGRGCWRRWC